MIALRNPAPGDKPAYVMIRAKCQQSGAPTWSRLCARDEAESRLKIGAPNPKV
jgi:hypothetical protein